MSIFYKMGFVIVIDISKSSNDFKSVVKVHFYFEML